MDAASPFRHVWRRGWKTQARMHWPKWKYWAKDTACIGKSWMSISAFQDCCGGPVRHQSLHGPPTRRASRRLDLSGEGGCRASERQERGASSEGGGVTSCFIAFPAIL